MPFYKGGPPGPGRPMDTQLLANDTDGWENFDKLLALQCTRREIAAFYGRSEDWIADRVQDVKGMTFQQYSALVKPKGLVSLRRKQMEMALAGDRTMLVWLGKQYLGQADKMDSRISGPDGKPIEIADASNPARLVLEGLAQISARQQLAKITMQEIAGASGTEIKQLAGTTEETRSDAGDDDDAAERGE